MFSLIITIVSIALVVALVAATMYHGGDTLTQGRTSADAAAFVAGAQQIAGAQVMNMSLTGLESPDVAALITAKALASAPVVKNDPAATVTAWAINTGTNVVSNSVKSAEVCAQINKTSGIKAADTAAATDTDADPLFPLVVAAATDLTKYSYGCDTAGKVFSFKY